VATLVNEEISSQNRLLSDLGSDVEKADSRMKQLNRNLRALSKDSDRGKYCLICVLLVLLVVLTLLVLS